MGSLTTPIDKPRYRRFSGVFESVADNIGLSETRTPFPALFFAQAVLLALLALSSDETSPLTSLFIAALAGAAAVIVLYVFYLRRAVGPSAMFIALTIFAAKVLLGCWHYVHFIDPTYLDGGPHIDFEYLWDYRWMHEAMKLAATSWRENGFGTTLPEEFWTNKNAYLLLYNSLLYFFGGIHPLNIAIWNTLQSIFTAAFVVAISAKIGIPFRHQTLVFAISALQPMTYISSLFERDMAGQLFVVIAAYLLVANRYKPVRLLCTLPISCFLAYCMREPYLFVPLIAVACMLMWGIDPSHKTKRLMGWLVLVIVLGVSYYATPLLTEATARNTSDFERVSGSGTAIVSFPFRVLKGVVGPFPWYQIFLVENTEYIAQDFLQQVMNVAMYWITFSVMTGRRWRGSSQPKIILIFAGALFLIGIYAPGIHSPYVSIGTVLLAPIVATAGTGRIRQALFVSLAGFLVANLVYGALGLTGSDVFGGLIQ